MKRVGKWFFMAVCVLLTSSAFAQVKDWAQFNRYAEANKNVKIPAKVVFMGNSITDGWWPADSTFFISNGYVDRGISGQTTSEMLVRFRADVINLKPKVVVILAGTNDVAQNNGYISLENAFGNIVSMVELARFNKITPILCSVMPAYEFGWRKGMEPAGKIIKLNEMIKAYADKHNLVYVDYHSALKDERNGLPANYSHDEVHPTLEAYKIMESIVHKAIQKVLK